jgi:ABC-type nitrate/sulfonate/bicarbonate transport system substrate-binding protein
LAAETQGLLYLLENPEESADIAAEYAAEQEISVENALRRFELQEELVIGSDGLPLRHMSAEQWNEWIILLYQYNEIEIPACE